MSVRTGLPALTSAAQVRAALRRHADAGRAVVLARFFKTGPGGYGAGDRFLGVTVPQQRAVARRARGLPHEDLDALLTSPIHEERLTALLVMVEQFVRSRDRTARGRIVRLYRRRLPFVNNWDLVDSSAEHIVGGWLADKPRTWLDRLATSRHLWSRRVAMLATFHFIKQGDHQDAIRIAGLLVDDPHDLIQKAVGWMLREVGKRASAAALETFLAAHAATMPRTTLRYAIERLPAADRARWLSAAAREGAPPGTRRRF